MCEEVRLCMPAAAVSCGRRRGGGRLARRGVRAAASPVHPLRGGGLPAAAPRAANGASRPRPPRDAARSSVHLQH